MFSVAQFRRNQFIRTFLSPTFPRLSMSPTLKQELLVGLDEVLLRCSVANTNGKLTHRDLRLGIKGQRLDELAEAASFSG